MSSEGSVHLGANLQHLGQQALLLLAEGLVQRLQAGFLPLHHLHGGLAARHDVHVLAAVHAMCEYSILTQVRSPLLDE